ncbi:MAG TPA: elongation factor P maturation arginine rhamnosyltransferase EarP [Burkholderiaceae bacterium]|nr:elongation factor P maturation arginine rhamnosyltransferase EarP [Burkholderiaceae bacterium]
MRWDLFCRVIDNLGDIGVCWRLAADLSFRGENVRLWIDHPEPLSWMAPGGAAGVEVQHWTEPVPDLAPGEVVIEAFGCDPPPAFIRRMVGAQRRPVWINLEYLSAEDYVERSHALPSPQMAGPGAGLTKWFFYPGFSSRTGGLIREPWLEAERLRFDRRSWLSSLGVQRREGERVLSLFCYDNAAMPSLLRSLSTEPTLVLLTPGPAQHGAAAVLERDGTLGRLRSVALPWLSQADYDRLLWSCDLNFVRGEDSFVRAQWAGVPFVWHIYPQHDGAHAAKLDAFLDRWLAGEPASLAAGATSLWHAWNGLCVWPAALPPYPDWAAACTRWRERLLHQDDLTTQLLRFVERKG